MSAYKQSPISASDEPLVLHYLSFILCIVAANSSHEKRLSASGVVRPGWRIGVLYLQQERIDAILPPEQTALEYFRLYCTPTDDVIDHIVHETNRYAEQCRCCGHFATIEWRKNSTPFSASTYTKHSTPSLSVCWSVMCTSHACICIGLLVSPK